MRAELDARLGGEPESFHAGVELGPGDPEKRRGLRLVPFGVLQGGENGAVLSLITRMESWSGSLSQPDSTAALNGRRESEVNPDG